VAAGPTVTSSTGGRATGPPVAVAYSRGYSEPVTCVAEVALGEHEDLGGEACNGAFHHEGGGEALVFSVTREWSYYAQLRIGALVRRFAPGWCYADEFPEKPPRIRWRTWARLREAVNEWEAVRDDVFI
jgi:hypothetical protein